MYLYSIPSFLLFIAAAVFAADYNDDPYTTLGVNKRATIHEIKRAYKSLAREWHPDKNSDPDAQEKFVSITKAYEVLSDPLRKERYDKFGTFDDSAHDARAHHGFDNFFGGFGGFGGFDDSLFAKKRISLRMYTHSILEKSNTQPYILYVYSNYCQSCFRLQNIWKAATDDLEALGYGIGTVNALTDGNLLEKLRVSSLPSIVAVVEGRTIHLRNQERISERTIRVFARDVIPNTFMEPIASYDKVRRFVDKARSTNQISVLILGSANEPRTRYLLTAMKYSHFARFAYVPINLASDEVASLKEALAIKCSQCDNVLIFNDYPENGPSARSSVSNANQLTQEALSYLIESNRFLTLPRLSSPQYLDELCPVSSRNPRRLCAILPVGSSATDVEFLETFRQFAKDNGQRLFLENKLQLAYIAVDKQSEWLKPFVEKNKGEISSKATDILVIWRFEQVKAKFTWLSKAWSGDAQALSALLERVVRQNIRLDDVAPVGTLANEHALPMYMRIARATWRMFESAWFHLTKEEAYPVLSFVGTFIVIICLGYTVSYFNQEKPVKRGTPRNMSASSAGEDTASWHPDDPNPKSKCEQPLLTAQNKLKRVMSIMSPHIHELRAETYFGMIRLLKPGCRSLILLVDADSKETLLPKFAQYIYPLRNNKTLSFGYLMVEKNLPWFRKLLEHTLPLGEENQPASASASGTLYERLKSINPRQTVGTVLALCGWKLYFSIYHPMHTEANSSHFLGFDDDEDLQSSDSDSETNKDERISLRRSSRNVSVDNVLNGFPNWLDRLLEGCIRRYYIPEWPENLK